MYAKVILRFTKNGPLHSTLHQNLHRKKGKQSNYRRVQSSFTEILLG